MTLTLTLTIIIIFLGGSYYMGNYFMDSLDEKLSERIVNSLFGILCWIVITACGVAFYGVYLGIGELLK